jgi:hypothetical protein
VADVLAIDAIERDRGGRRDRGDRADRRWRSSCPLPRRLRLLPRTLTHSETCLFRAIIDVTPRQRQSRSHAGPRTSGRRSLMPSGVRRGGPDKVADLPRKTGWLLWGLHVLALWGVTDNDRAARGWAPGDHAFVSLRCTGCRGVVCQKSSGRRWGQAGFRLGERAVSGSEPRFSVCARGLGRGQGPRRGGRSRALCLADAST